MPSCATWQTRLARRTFAAWPVTRPGSTWPASTGVRATTQPADSMADALQGVVSVVMISAPVKPGTDRVQMHRNVVAAAEQAAVRQLLYTSVIGNGDEEGTMYRGCTEQVNRVAEQDLQESGLDLDRGP